ncbi:sugar phosphate isomerase/epimerase family protein [Companilactobacillus baiquanensis]|uniref:Sugar phosphate isomerase/epimerase family protein n=1 Tax=Companilactobacillus baiquanensis TaxID=2486005 RepID=A0ABW1UV08_9LACO|nr:TIM barrel protein [Companilactobacillus baiquanensis]
MTKILVNTAVFEKDVKNGSSQLDMIKKITDLGIDGVEVRGEFFGEDRDQELTALKDLAQSKNWLLYFSIPEQLFVENKINENLTSYLDLAKKYSIGSLKISLGEIDTLNDELVAELKNTLAPYDVQLTIENEQNEHGHMDHVLEINKEIKQAGLPIGYTFDAGNWYWINEDPEKAMDKLSSYVTILHLKNIQNKGTVLLDKGATNWKNLINAVTPDIPVAIEYPMTLEELKSEFKLVQDAIEQSV